MRETLARLQRVGNITLRTEILRMCDDSMENYSTIDLAHKSIPAGAVIFGESINLPEIENGKSYAIELQSGEIHICDVERDRDHLLLSFLNPEFNRLAFAKDKVKAVYRISKIQIDR